ncbi:uncharacterized protein LOC128985478 [Macrosteles quadrilineatus]|uniref:uncharacterized protein LOC128985478 n=1 Tax=Macrosteles quadrilineatus TaxID=74068 RepID=UPI0023E0F85B|nr:uncharacterized protein LOC128985478 [Macrosteles quadrilineatus]
MKQIITLLLALYTVQAKPRPQYHHRPLLGSIAPTQLPPLGDDVHGSQAVQGGEDLDVHEARSYQTGYRLQSTGYRVPVDPQNYPTQVPPIRANEAADIVRTYDTGYRLQTTGPVSYPPPSRPTGAQPEYFPYSRVPSQPVDYRTNVPKDVVPILTYSNDVAYDGSYNYNFETADGIARQERGVMTNQGTDSEGPSVQGSYSYTAPDGQLITVHYTADENGFRAEGAHLPTPPPVPEEIARSLEFIARVRASQPAGAAGYEDDGQYHPELYRDLSS